MRPGRQRKADLAKEFSKYTEYWVGDVLEDDDGVQYTVEDVFYSPNSGDFVYEVESESQRGWAGENFWQYFRMSQMEIVEKAERPEGASLSEDEYDDVNSVPERIEDLTENARFEE